MATRKQQPDDLGQLVVRDVMCGRVRVVAPDTPLSEVVRLFGEKRIHHAIVERDGRLVGILSDRDILPVARVRETRSCADPAPALVSDVMTARVETVAPGEKIAGALIRMLERGVNALVVAEGRKTLGILTTTDFLTLLLDLTVGAYVEDAKPRARRSPAGPRQARSGQAGSNRDTVSRAGAARPRRSARSRLT